MSLETQVWLEATLIRSSFWSTVLALCWTWLFSYGILVTQNPFDIFSTGAVTLVSLFSPIALLYVSLIVLCVLLWAKLQSAHMSVVPFVGKSVISTFSSSFQSKILVSFLQFAATGLVIGWCVLKLGGLNGSLYADLFPGSDEKVCVIMYGNSGDRGSCLNQAHIFLLLAALFAGVLEAVDFHFKNGNYMNLPIIPLDNYSQVKLKLQSEMMNFAVKAVKSLKNFYIIYLLVTILLGSIYNPAGLSYSQLFSPSLAASGWFIFFFIKMVSRSISSCLVVFSTNPVTHVSIPDLLQGLSSDNKLFSLLCFQDLSEQVVEREEVRREVFSLSMPGGHPHTWNTVLKACNRSLSEMNKGLSDIFSPPIQAQKNQETAAEGSVASHVMSPHIRRLAPLAPQKEATPTTSSPSLWDKLASQWDAVIQSLKKRPLVGWLVTTPPDVSFRLVFARSQEAIFAVEILSHIVRTSISEDNYGVVQKDLAAILTCLLSLEQNIDRCRGQGVVYRKKTAGLPDIHLKQELKCAVKSAIFRIVLTFGDHILSVPLSSEFKQKIQNYQNFLEA